MSKPIDPRLIVEALIRGLSLAVKLLGKLLKGEKI